MLEQDNRDAKLLVAAGSLSLLTTFLASRGDLHSKFHKRISRAAIFFETVTISAGFGLMISGDDNKTLMKTCKTVGLIGLGTTALCYAAVAVTDEPLTHFFQSDKGKGDMIRLPMEVCEVFTRHMVEGINSITKNATTHSIRI